MKKNISLLLLVLLAVVSGFAQRVTPYQGSRIFWDFDTETTVISGGNYARMIELQDGRLMTVAESNGIVVAYSSNQGKSWTSPQRIVSPPDGIFYAVPDLIQLSDGTILVGFNPRPRAPYSPERRFGIRAVCSIDNGISWSEPIFVFDAQHTFNDGCWEPAFLELPSGEVQCYFANENEYTYNSDQNISLCRSSDKGLSWSSPTTVCYRQGSRDGMPVPLLLKDESEIVVIIEDNGWPGRAGFTATTVRNTLADNWTKGFVNASSPNRGMIFQQTPAANLISAAPHIRKLPWGETVASYQTNENRPSNHLEYSDMQVLVGNDRARNFKAKSNPFALGNDKRAIWNSLAVIDTGIVVAVASIGAPNGANDIRMIKGYPIRQAKAGYGTIIVDGQKTSGEKWTTTGATQLLLGASTSAKSKIDFAYDDTFLYFTALVIDRTIINTGIDNDGIRLLIDAHDVSSASPQNGMYEFFFDTNGSVRFRRAGNGAWTTDTNVADVQYAIQVKSVYYQLEAAIPWSKLGKSYAPVDSRLAIAVENTDKQQYTLKTHAIADVNNNASWTWLDFRLVRQITATPEPPPYKKEGVNAFVANNTLFIDSEESIREFSFCSFDGRLITQKSKISRAFQIPLHNLSGGVLRVVLTDGKVLTQKVFCRK